MACFGFYAVTPKASEAFSSNRSDSCEMSALFPQIGVLLVTQ